MSFYRILNICIFLILKSKDDMKNAIIMILLFLFLGCSGVPEKTVYKWNVFLPRQDTTVLKIDTITNKGYLPLDEDTKIRTVLLDSLIDNQIEDFCCVNNLNIWIDTIFYDGFEGKNRQLVKLYFNHKTSDFVITTIYQKDLGFLFVMYHSYKGNYRLVEVQKLRNNKVYENIDLSNFTEQLLYNQDIFPPAPPIASSDI